MYRIVASSLSSDARVASEKRFGRATDHDKKSQTKKKNNITKWAESG